MAEEPEENRNTENAIQPTPVVDEGGRTEHNLPEELIEELPPEAREFVKNLPPDKRSGLLRVFSERMMIAGPWVSPIERKITPEHIGQIIKVEDQKNQREYEAAQSGRKYNFLYLIVGAITFLALTFMLLAYSAKDFLLPVLQVAAGFIGGLGIGYGVGRRKA